MSNIKRNPAKYIKALGALYIILAFFNVTIDSIMLNFEYYQRFDIFVMIITPLLNMIQYAPYILFLVYIAVGYKKKKDHILLKVSFVLSLVMYLISAVGNITTLLNENMNYSQEWGEETTVFAAILNVIFCAVFLFFIVDVFSGFKYKKISQKLAIAEIGAFAVYWVILIVFYLNYEAETETYISLLGTVVVKLFYFAANLIFWFVAVPFKATTPLEIDLEELRVQYEAGAISTEEYEMRKFRILEKL